MKTFKYFFVGSVDLYKKKLVINNSSLVHYFNIRLKK